MEQILNLFVNKFFGGLLKMSTKYCVTKSKKISDTQSIAAKCVYVFRCWSPFNVQDRNQHLFGTISLSWFFMKSIPKVYHFNLFLTKSLRIFFWMELCTFMNIISNKRVKNAPFCTLLYLFIKLIIKKNSHWFKVLN